MMSKEIEIIQIHRLFLLVIAMYVCTVNVVYVRLTAIDNRSSHTRPDDITPYNLPYWNLLKLVESSEDSSLEYKKNLQHRKTVHM